MKTKRIKLLAVATASMLFLAGCGDNTAEGIREDVRETRSHLHHKNHIAPAKFRDTRTAAQKAKDKAAHLTAAGLRKGANAADTVERKMDETADYMDN